MNNKKTYCSPKLEVVAFDEEDILTVSTYGGGTGDKPGDGSGTTIDFDTLTWG